MFSGKKGKHKVSTYDILINIMPFCLVLTGIGLLQFILLCFAPLIDGVGFWSVIWPYLRTMLMFTGISFVTCMLSAIVIFIVERKRIKNVKWWQKIIMTFCWPLFLLIQFPIDVVAVCQKNVGWKVIPHSDTTEHEDLNTESEQNNENKTAETETKN